VRRVPLEKKLESGCHIRRVSLKKGMDFTKIRRRRGGEGTGREGRKE